MTKAPALFVSHGAPTFALEPGVLGPRLTELGKKLSGSAAALVVSPHWRSTGPIRVMQSSEPGIMYDFTGFASELYELDYPAPGAPAIARVTAELVRAGGFDAQLDRSRALDHGAWVPLRYLLPDATLPVFQLSLPERLDTQGALQLGQAIAPLRERGIAIIGSGGITHNLFEFRGGGADAQYARDFAEWINRAVMRRDIRALVNYRNLAPHATRAHPTEEHYLPLLVALGTVSPGETVTYMEGGLTHGILSMDSYAWGVPEQLHSLEPKPQPMRYAP